MRTRVRALAGLARPSAVVDLSTPEGRSRERYRRAAFSSAAAGVGRGIQILTLLISIPLAVGYLGPERYGLWATISSLVALLAFADAGLGNGLVSAVSEADGRGDTDAARTHVSSAFFMLLVLALALGTAFALAYPFVPWDWLYNVKSPVAVREAGVATAVFAACFLATLPASVVERTQLGYQEGYVNGVWAALGSVVGLVGVVTAIALEASLPWLVLALAGAPLAALVMNGAVLFARRRPWLRPRVRLVTAASVRRLVRLGAMFFVLQLAVAVAFTSDNIVVARLLGPEAVTEYSVAMRLFTVAPMLLVLLFNPLWPAYGEAVARGDVRWVKVTLARSLALAVAVTLVASGILVAFGVEIVHLWVGSAVTPTFWLLLGLGAWAVLTAAGNALAMFLNGVNVITFQAVSAVVMATTALVAKIVFGGIFGLPGIIWGTVAAYTLFTAIPFAVLTPRLISRLAAAHAGSPADRLATTS